MKMYRLLLFVVLALAIAIMPACSGSNNAPDNKDDSNKPATEKPAESPDQPAAKKIRIGFSQGTMNHPWRVAMIEGNKKYAEENLKDVELIITDGQNQASKQVSDVESLIAQDIDVLIISPLTSDALTPVVKKAMDKGIPVVTADRKVNTDVTLHLGAENYPIGVKVAEFLNQKLNGKGKIVEIQGTAGASATVERDGGFVDTLKKYSGLEVVATQNADYLREPAMKFMEDTLQRFGPGQIQAVYAHNDEMALGALQAIEAVHREKEIMVIGVDGENLAIDAVKSGKLGATFTYPWCAPDAIQYAYKIAKGEKVEKEIKLDSSQIDSSNVDQWIGKGF